MRIRCCGPEIRMFFEPERFMFSGRYMLTWLLPDDLARALVFPESEKHRLTQPIIPSPP